MPYIRPGTYTLQLSLDTKSVLGKLIVKRTVKVIDSTYADLCNKYYYARKSDNKRELEKLRSRIISTYKNNIKPAVRRTISGAAKCSFGDYPGSGKFAAVVTWLPGKDSLRVKADVVDSSFSLAAQQGANASGIDLYICPSGIYEDNNKFTIIPSGSNGKAKVSVDSGEYGVTSGEPKDLAIRAKAVNAKWKRTAKGYTVDVTIPWSIVRGYQPSWKSMPIDMTVDSNTPDGTCRIKMGTLGDPASEIFTLSALMPK